MKPKKILALMAAFFFIAILLPAGAWATDSGKVNINTATKEQLTSLNGVGPAIADRIIEHRNTIGPFEKPEDIQLVKGVGEKIYEANKDRITVGSSQ